MRLLLMLLSKRSGTIVMGVTCARSSLATRKLEKIGRMAQQTGHLHERGIIMRLLLILLSKRWGNIVTGVTCARSSLATRKLGRWSGRLGTFMKGGLS